jgi:hypothetical protein
MVYSRVVEVVTLGECDLISLSQSMPKLKTRKAAATRFRATAVVISVRRQSRVHESPARAQDFRQEA